MSKENRTMKVVKRNDTTVQLDDDLIQPADDFDLGYIKAKCPHCSAHLYLSDDGTVTCLNACFLPSWQERKLRQGLIQAMQALNEDDES